MLFYMLSIYYFDFICYGPVGQSFNIKCWVFITVISFVMVLLEF